MSAIHCCFHPQIPLKEDIMSKMLEASNYWYPDATSKASNKANTCRLAKASLFNTALSKKDDIFTDKQTGSIISANARLDNRTELLGQLSIEEPMIPDGELILRAYLKRGRNCTGYLFGDFVFIIWYEINQKKKLYKRSFWHKTATVQSYGKRGYAF